jgi:hypothetical protein
MIVKKQFVINYRLISTILAGSMVLSACSAAVAATSLPFPLATATAKMAIEPTSTSSQVESVIPTIDNSHHIYLETGAIATGFQVETVPAVSANDNGPYWELLPEYYQLTLQGYPISNHLMKPQIFIYPADELGKVNDGAGKIVTTLKTLIQTPQEMPNMPFLPLFNASQVMHAQVQYLDFKNGKGVRYLTEFDQGIMPINNEELIYTYQGLTSDGKYYVAAVMPVNHPSLPADGKITGNEPPEFTSDHQTYVTKVATDLNQQDANSFTPDLTQLDAMMGSMEIN